VRLSERQREVLERMSHGGVLSVKLEPGETGVHETCWIGAVGLLPMTVNALITARLIEPDKTFKSRGCQTTSYVMSFAGQAALKAS
jgi:hypothetical protein